MAKTLTIGERLTYWRKKLSFNQSELAKQSGISQSAISLIENGENQPTVQTIETLCNAMGISLMEFFAESSTSKNSIHVFEPDEQTPEQIKREFRYVTKDLTPKQIKQITQMIKSLKS